MNKTDLISIDKIEKAIHFIRGEKAMLDRDLALLYGVETKVLNRAVKRNLQRFPLDFMFQLTEDGAEAFEVPNWNLKQRAWWETLSAVCLH